MMFIVTSLDHNQHPEDFAFQLATFEEGLDFVSKLVAKGDVLLRVAIVDRHTLLSLPTEIFDGANFSQPMRQLATEWQAILAKPMTNQRDSGDWVARWLAWCESRILHQAQLIASVRNEMKALECLLVNTPTKSSSLRQYYVVLSSYEVQLTRICALRQRLQQRRGRSAG